MTLPDFWLIVIALLWTGYFFLEGFDFGVGVMLKLLGRDNDERSTLMGTIGPVWDGNEVWLITAVGATFAAFPEWYGAMFSAYYLPTFVILVALILRGLAIEYRHKRHDDHWLRNWDHVIFWTSLVVPFLWGVLLANLMRGLSFGPDHVFRGNLLEVFNPFALLGGVFTVVLFTFHGAVFTALKTSGPIRRRANGLATWLGLPTVVVAVAYLAWASLAFGGTPAVVAAAIAVLALIAATAINFRAREGWAFLASGIGVIASTAMVFLAMFPAVMRSSLDPAFDMTVDNTAAGHYTLVIMTWIAGFATPMVLMYQSWSYWVFRQRIASPGTEHPSPTAHRDVSARSR
ncbi:cytochrome d ubiquinol oxidase subunit II [Pseudonocardia phyllosphaerae]|uniref:cytochrome d ubiquinol oxidase subunit II n=1 Tax=Pseudonocardia phyllosphaerae TaxID=3390502 RepID=UPI003978E5EC